MGHCTFLISPAHWMLTCACIQAGQERKPGISLLGSKLIVRIGYKSLAPIYFRNSNAAVIVYDITQVCTPSFICQSYLRARLPLT